MLYYFFRTQDFLISKWLFSLFRFSTVFLFCHENLHMFHKNRLFRTVKKIDSKDIKTRTYDLQRHRDEYTISKSDFVWSVNEYCKLNDWDLKIYACINAYFRNIIWIYVDLFARTAISVKSQYVKVMKKNNVISQFIRSNHDVKIILMIDSHYRLSQKMRTKIFQKKILFNECYLFDTNTTINE